jgi:site-specific DNA-cytosine methylase
VNQLWPRLSTLPARLLHDERGSLDVRTLARLSAADHPKRTFAATGGVRVSDRQILDLVTELRQSAEELGYPEPPTDTRTRTAFDRAAAEILFRHMRINTVEAATNEVWNFLALVAAPHLARWRWFDSSNQERWISTDRTRHMFARLWWQALTFADMPDGGTDYSLLNALIERDLNQITERRSIGGVPRLARAVGRLALTDGSHDTEGSDLLRRITPPLRRRVVFIDFASLSDDQIDDQLRAIRADLPPKPQQAQDDEHASTPLPVAARPLTAGTTTSVIARPAPPEPTPRRPDIPSQQTDTNGRLRFVDLCSGAGGLALGLEQASLEPILLLDNRSITCETVRANRPAWNVVDADVMAFDPSQYVDAFGVDLLSAGLPRVQAAATAARIRGSEQEIELLRKTIDLVSTWRPRGLLVDNVPGLARSAEYTPVRTFVAEMLADLGYEHEWFVADAADHGVPQNRPHGVLVALEPGAMRTFGQPGTESHPGLTVGRALYESMALHGWRQVDEWAAMADRLAPTLVGGSWERGGADLGPTGSKNAWATLGVDGGTIADGPPGPDFRLEKESGRYGVPLTVRQVARLQGFPDDWILAGRKTAQYRQVAAATPPPLAAALGRAVAAAIVAGYARSL